MQFLTLVENETKIRSINRTQFLISIENETKTSIRTKKNLIQNQNENFLLSMRRKIQFNVYDTNSGFFRKTFIETEQQLQKKIAAMKRTTKIEKITMTNNESKNELISIMKNRVSSKSTQKRKKRDEREMFRKRK